MCVQSRTQQMFSDLIVMFQYAQCNYHNPLSRTPQVLPTSLALYHFDDDDSDSAMAFTYLIGFKYKIQNEMDTNGTRREVGRTQPVSHPVRSRVQCVHIIDNISFISIKLSLCRRRRNPGSRLPHAC